MKTRRIHEPLSQRALVALILVCAGSLLAAILFGVYGEPDPDTPHANTFSRSAIGHAALLLVLEEGGVPFVVSRWHSAERADAGSVLAIVEPADLGADLDGRDTLEEMLDEAPLSLVVLPKYRGVPSEENPYHLDSVDFVPERDIVATLDAVGVAEGAVRFHGAESRTASFTGLSPAPSVGELQVFRGTNVEPHVTTDGGIYLGSLTRPNGNRVFILSDPDIFATHGLVDGDNPDAALAVLSAVAEGRTLIFDETLHGFELEPSLSREMLSFPLVFLVLQTVLLGAALLWLAVGRFGGPREEEGPVVLGQIGIIRRTAEVLARAHQGGNTVNRFFIMHVRDVARRLGAPPVRSQDELVRWLADAGQKRGVRIDIQQLREDVRLMALENKVDRAEAVLLAARIHRWKTSILQSPHRAFS